MNSISFPPLSVPRLNSLRHRLQKNPGPEDETRLDQLMLFLDDPPAGITDRWKAGAEMCAAWGITTSGMSVWRLFNSYALEWCALRELGRKRIARESDEGLVQLMAHMTAIRTCEILSNPNAPVSAVISLVRLGLRREALALSRDKHGRLLDLAVAKFTPQNSPAGGETGASPEPAPTNTV